MNTFHPNPYTAMLLTYHAGRFYGREREIINILQVITAAEPNGHAINGIRTIGKTTLVKFLKDPSGALREYEGFISPDYRVGGRRRLLFVHTNFHHFQEGDSIYLVMLMQLEDELEASDFDPSMRWHGSARDWGQADRQQIVEVLRSALHDLDKSQSVRVVFFLDDFDRPLRTIDPVDDGLLRTLSDLAVLIIITEDPIVELRPDIDKTSSPLLGILRPEYIGLLSTSAARMLIHEPAKEADVTFSSQEEDFLLTIAGRQPFLLTAACELYFEMRRDYPELGGRLDAEADRATLSRQMLARLSSMPHITSVLQITWTRLDGEEQAALAALARPGVHGGAETEYATVAARLANKGLTCLDDFGGDTMLFSQLFSEFVRRVASPSSPVGPFQPSAAHASTADGEHLSPIDRALLDYFLEHHGQVCSFEDILDAVWEDGEKSKRALEAAVHRLRKHLRPGQQIKSVRGIGYKFIAERAYSRA